jgi:uncharacterized membrane protein YfcA
MEIIGFIGALLMGLTLGLIGGGGSILTVPILVYLFSVDTVLATAYSLFIVGLTSLIGSFSHISQGNVHWRTAIVFGIPSIISVYLTRLYLVPLIPTHVFQIGDFMVTKSLMILIFFALLMVFASYTMIRKQKKEENKPLGEIKYNYPLILIEGVVVGTITGFVGAGGGFLIIPALVLLAKLPMKQAVGTSLVIIALKSLIGFTGDLKGSETIDWQFLGSFSVIAIIGIIIGSLLSKKVEDEKLKPAFGYFVLIMGIYIITKELFFQHA